MNPFTFQVPSNILFESGASKKVADLAAGFGAQRILLVTDRGVRDAGLTRAAEDALKAAGRDLVLFEDVVADPPSEVIERAVSLCRDERIDLVLSIGGGSALDTAKLVAYLAKSGDRLDDIYGVGLAKGQRLPLLLVPTTAGTGSEVTPIAIVTTPTTEKKGVVSPRLLPDWAILDPELTLGLPSHVTAATGIDAMVHAIEAYTSRHKKNPMSDQLARQALALLSQNIREVCRNGAKPRGARADAARIDAGRHGLRQRAGGGRACTRLSDRSDFPCAAWAVERPRADGRAALQPAGRRDALCGARTHRRSRGSRPSRRRGGITVRGGPRRHLPRLQGAGIAGGGRGSGKRSSHGSRRTR